MRNRKLSSNLLTTIESPADLKPLSLSELDELCQELREYIIQTIDQVGGHLAPTLGVIELTTVLHYLYDSPRDKMVWDVGHQAYAHKVLTGRREQLKTIRQLDGLAPFCHRTESEHDAFGAGHASTAISSALGLAAARDLQGEDFRVLAIVGDGAMTGGLSYEGLNNAGADNRQLTIILNDNEMSISPNVGAIHHYLTKVVTNPLYNRMRDEIWELTGRLPRGAKHVRHLARKFEESVKNLLTPGMLFEHFGFRYFGPIDGHNIEELYQTFRSVRELNNPVVVHVLTKKGKGYPNVDQSPVRFHSVKGLQARKESTSEDAAPQYSTVFGEVAMKLAEVDSRVVAITPAMCEGADLVAFRERFPDRYFDVGIAEGHAVTFAAGMAAQGMRPVVSVYSTFLQRGYDNLLHDVALQRLPVIFCLDRAGIVGGDGATHQGVFDLSYLQHIPDVVISAPKDGNELRNLMHTALAYQGGPFSIRYPKASSRRYNPDADPKPVEIGTWEHLRDGEGVVALAVGSMVPIAEQVLERFSMEGVRLGLVNARFIKPLDTEMLETLMEEYDHLVTVEENALIGGFGSRIQEYAAGAVEITRIGVPDRFIPHGSRAELLDLIGLSEKGLEQTLRELLTNQRMLTSKVS